jgi:hypothetical protein
MGFLGFKSKHGLMNLKWIKDYDFCNDIFVATKYKFLDHIFPTAKFIVTVRDFDSWIRSSKVWFAIRQTENLTRKESVFAAYGTNVFEEDKFTLTYIEYYAAVFKYFEGREDKYLVMDICGGDGWEMLCPFVGKEILLEKFPDRNKMTKRRLREYRRVCGEIP